jgi:hypothetical protein
MPEKYGNFYEFSDGIHSKFSTIDNENVAKNMFMT